MALKIKAVLFDLDGTVLDTAPDMVAALNLLRHEHALESLPYAEVRSAVSHGAARMVNTGFPHADAHAQETLQKRFLQLYRNSLSRETRLFPGMEQVLSALESWHLKSGIVTNKAAWLTGPLLEELGLQHRFVSVVSGDTLAERKPHPRPLLHAAELAGVAAAECIYVGDAERDVQAAHAAHMPALVADYGYLHADEDSKLWAAEGYLSQPSDLLDWLSASGRL